MLDLPINMDGRYREKMADYVRKLISSRDVGVLAVLLFGSLARGRWDPYPESDIDLLIIAESLPPNPAERRLRLLPLKEGESIFEDLWLTRRELHDALEGGWGVVLDALADGMILYDPHNILTEAKKLALKRHDRIGRVWRIRRR